MQVSVFKNAYHIKTPPEKIHIDKVLRWIKYGAGDIKSKIEKLRSSTNEEEQAEIKKSLLSVVFSGHCNTPIEKQNSNGDRYISYREDASLTTHSGFCVIDIDYLDDLNKWKQFFKEDDRVYSFFVSPSGKGLKVIYKIPSNVSTHRNYYLGILEYLESQGLSVDKTSINESRLCFVSHDPEIYVNKNAVEFKTFVVIEEQETKEGKKGTGLTDYQKLSIAARMIDLAKDGEKHTTLVKASYLLGGYIKSNFIDEDEARKMLRARIKAKNPRDLRGAYKTIDDGLKEGKKKPIYEIEKIESEFNMELARQQYLTDEGVYSFLVDEKDMEDKIQDILVNGIEIGKPIGIPKLDDHFRLKENNFSVFLGHDNVGKSFWTWWVASVSSALYGWKWVIYSPENNLAKIKIKIMDFLYGKKISSASQEVYRKIKAFVDEHFIFIRKDVVYDIFSLLDFTKLLIDEHPNIKGLLIDPYNSLALDYKNKGKGLNSYEYHMRAISEIRIFAEKYCTVYVNAHSVTEARRVKIDDQNNMPRPHKSHIDGGAIWANRCDDFYVIHRQVKNSERWMYTELHADKIKDVDTGGGLTRGDDDAVLMQLINQHCDFVGEGSNQSVLKEWRIHFLGVGEQKRIELKDLKDVF